MSTTIAALDEARDLIASRLADLEDERQRLERALAELGGKATRRSPGRPRGSKAAAKASAPALPAPPANAAAAPVPTRL